MKHVNLFANSCGIGWPYSIHFFGSAPFSTNNTESVDIVRSVGQCADWLYFPRELGEALLERGVESTIYCHSGEVLRYLDNEFIGEDDE